MKKEKYNSLALGLVIAILLPLLVFACVYLFHYKNIPAYQVLGLKAFIQTNGSKILSLCAIVNLAPFYLFLQTERMRSVRGVVFGTLTVGVLVFLLFLLG